MTWTVLVPMKPGGASKTRLMGHLSPEERARLAGIMLLHVVDVLGQVDMIDDVVVIGDGTVAGPAVRQIRDRGSGLNAELQAARASVGNRPVAVFLADLPLLTSRDVTELLASACAHGCALAADRHDMGTNALALVDGRDFRFHFGSGSLAGHAAEAGPDHVVLRRPGLAIDCDTPADLDLLLERGFAPDF